MTKKTIVTIVSLVLGCFITLAINIVTTLQVNNFVLVAAALGAVNEFITAVAHTLVDGQMSRESKISALIGSAVVLAIAMVGHFAPAHAALVALILNTLNESIAVLLQTLLRKK